MYIKVLVHFKNKTKKQTADFEKIQYEIPICFS